MESGQLETAPTADLLRRYADEDATGCLRLEQEDMQARVYFRSGLVYAATAPGARARLGDRLVGAGHITDEDLAATLEQQRTLPEPRRIGELLIERGLIDRETMRAFVREQSTDSVAVTMGWQAGTWTFSPDEEVPEDVPLDMSVENLVMEGSRRLEQWEVIQARIGSVDAVVDFRPSGDAAELALTPDEWAMLTRIDGQSSIAEIADAAGYGEFEAARIIYGLLTAGVVSLVDDGELVEEEDELLGAGEPSGAGEDELLGAGEASRSTVPPYDPDEVSGLFGELGLGADVPEAPPRTDEEHPAEPEAAEEPPPPAGTPPPPRPVEPVNRNELLREFAALDDDGSDDDAPRRPPPPPPRPSPPQQRDEARDRDRDKKRGLFGRRRRD